MDFKNYILNDINEQKISVQLSKSTKAILEYDSLTIMSTTPHGKETIVLDENEVKKLKEMLSNM